MKILNIIDLLSSFIGFPREDIKDIIRLYSKRYSQYKIPKASGGSRVIRHPSRPLKVLQYATISLIFNSLPVSSIAYAYIKGKCSPLKLSCDIHNSYKYTIRIDFKDFFHSLSPEDLFLMLEKKFKLSSEDRDSLSNLLFFKLSGKYILPIGSPASPMVSNIIMHDIDYELEKSAYLLDKESSISRYADDLYFSTNKQNMCRSYHNIVKTLCIKSINPKLEINESKTLYMSKGTKRAICGMIATCDGKTSIGRKRKEFIKRQMYMFQKNKLPTEEINSLKGYLAFVKDCEPSFYNKLIIKYGSSILNWNA